MRTIAQLGPLSLDLEGEPAPDAMARLVTSADPTGDDGSDEVKLTGPIVRVMHRDRLLVHLVYTSEEAMRESFPQLAVIERSASGGPWRIVQSEAVFSEAADDSLLEEARVQVVTGSVAHCLRRIQEASASRFQAMMFEQDRPVIEARLERARTWHRTTRRPWPLE
jgi:hypothetical protein